MGVAFCLVLNAGFDVIIIVIIIIVLLICYCQLSSITRCGSLYNAIYGTLYIFCYDFLNPLVRTSHTHAMIAFLPLTSTGNIEATPTQTAAELLQSFTLINLQYFVNYCY